MHLTEHANTFRILAFSIALLSSFSCDQINHALGRDEKDKTNEWLFWLGLLPAPADYYAHVYYVDPLIVGSPTNPALIHWATSADVHSGKKKLILVHGWHYDDRDFIGNYPSGDALKDRILAQNWSDFFGQGDFATFLSACACDIYAFDYLTAASVDSNGARLRAQLDSLFASGSDSVVLYGHSMGGLVSRFAVYNGSDPTYITRVITTGTPFHGSPWASPQFTGSRGPLGSLAAFFTDTDGGHNLGWDNYDTSLPGSSNPTLDSVNALTSRDGRFYAYSSTLMQASPGTGTLAPACTAFLDGTWDPSDCIVPARSAQLSGHALGSTWSAGAYDHIQIKMEIASIRGHFYTDVTSAP